MPSAAPGEANANSEQGLWGPRWRRLLPGPRWRRGVGWALGILASPVLLIALAFGTDRALSAGQVLRGVWVGDLALSGMDRDEAFEALGSVQSVLRSTPVVIRIRRQLFSFAPEEIELRLDRKATWACVEAAGRSGSLSRQLGWWLDRWTQEAVACRPRVKLDGERLSRLVDSWQTRAIADPAFEGGIRVEDGRLVAQAPKEGWALEVASVEKRLVEALETSGRELIDLEPSRRQPRVRPEQVDRALSRASALVSGPIVLRSEDPELELELDVGPSDLKKALVARVVERPEGAGLELEFSEEAVGRLLAPLLGQGALEPRDATFVVDGKEQVTIVPGRDGRALEPRAVAQALLEAALTEARQGRLPVGPGKPPKLTTQAAEGLGIRGLVATFTTRHPCCRPRVKNIHRIAEILDGLVVFPGETVSVNQVVGPRTETNGFVPAPSIEDGEMVDTVGGGISQFATTLFNAVLHGGYGIVERQPHTYYFDRYPMGHEATLSWPKPDLVFKNDTQAGLLIKTHAADKSITIKLYGDHGGRKVETRVSAPQDIVQPPVEFVGDRKLALDKEHVADQGRIGWSVIAVRRITMPDGTVRQESRKVTYKPETRIVEIHPCRIPKGEKGHTGEPCPVPEETGAAGAPGTESGSP